MKPIQLITEAERKQYWQRLKGRFGSSLIAYWPLWEPAGTSGAGSVKDITPNARHGTPSNVTFGGSGIGDQKAAAAFDGVNSYINVYSTSFRDAFIGTEGTIIFWTKLTPAVWADGTRRDVIGFTTTAAASYISIRKDGSGIVIQHHASATDKVVTLGTNSPDWFCAAVTWSNSNNRMRIYYNGIQQGDDTTGLGAWGASQLISSSTCIGAYNTSAINPFSGQIAHVAVLNREATPAEIAGASNCGGFRSPGSGAAVITFDDGLSNIYGGLTYLKNRGKVATCYVITSLIGDATHLSAAQLQEMDAAGFAIANHTHDHANLTTLTEAQQEAELSGGQADLDALGLTRASRHVAYPNGASNADTLTAMTATGMLTGRIVTPTAEVNPATMVLFQIPTTSDTILTSSLVGHLEQEIMLGVTQGYYCVMLFHQLADNPAGGEYSNANFQKIVDWIVASGIQTKTIIDLYNAKP